VDTLSSNALSRLLPAGSRLLTSLRDIVVISLPAGPAHQHIGVIWDRGRDEQILDVITAITYRDSQLRSRIIAMAMERGILNVWYAADNTNLTQDRNAIQLACDAALNAPVKRWKVADLIPVPIEARPDRLLLDRKALGQNHPLLVLPSQYQLGLISSTKDDSRRGGAK
jgi:hypothetical protein